MGLFPLCALAQIPQTILFTAPPPQQAYAGTSVILAATATSGLPVTFSVVSGPARVSGANGSTLTYTGVGTVIVQADQPGGNGYSAAPSVQASAVTVTLLTEPVTTRSNAVSTAVTFTNAGTLDHIAALTQGAINLDFSLPAASVNPAACIQGHAYAAGQTCVVEFYFTPTRPGIRYGGLTLLDASGNLLANSYIYAYGVGPQVVYEPIVQSQIGNSLGEPSGVAINGYGDIFVSNLSGSGLTEIAANGTVTPIGNFVGCKDVAVDGSGNVFVVTYDTLYEVMAVNGKVPASPTIRTLATGFTVDGGGLAVDGSGNAYVANGPAASTKANPTGVIYEVEAVDGVIPSMSSKQIIGPALAGPTGVAVDQNGNVYVSDGTIPAIFEMLAVNGRVPTSPVVQSIGTGYVLPSNIRLDNTNDIYISDAGYPGILKYTATNGVVAANATPKSLGTGFLFPQGLLVDGGNNVYVADRGFSEVIKLNYSTVPTLSFASTLVGQTSTDSPQTVTYTNAGNADLIFVPPTAGTNPAITSSFTLSTNSTCPLLSPGSPVATLPVGQTCTDIVSFTPLTAGTITGTLTTVDNDLSVPNATQVIQLNGVGLLKTPKLVFAIADHYVDDPPFPVTATSDSPGAITYSLSSGPASLAGSTITLSGTPGVVSVVATQAAVTPYDTASATAIFNVIKHPQTISFAQPTTPTVLAASPVTLVATASSGLPVTLTVLSGPATINGNTLALTGFGPIVVAANQAGNSIYSAATQVTRQLVVLDNRVTVTLTGTPNPVFIKNPITFTANTTSPAGTPTGTVTFFDSGAPLATVPLNGGAGNFTTSALALGQHNITAVYSGDATFASTTSAPFSALVEDFSLTISNPDLTIQHGGTAVYHFTVATVGGTLTASTIQFSIAGNPDRSPLTFSPAQIAAGSNTTTGTLTIQMPPYPVGPWIRGATSMPKITLAFLGLGTLFGLARRRRLLGPRLSRLATLLLILGLSISVTALNGCGSGWGPQAYPMTVTATSGNLSHTTEIHLLSK